jgi:HD-GYP domain-containing protein (c-di-GMP phosphodiesterase class II)
MTQLTEQGSFFPVHIDSLEIDALEMDLYIRYQQGEPTLYRAQGVDFTTEDWSRLLDQGIEFLYVPMSQHAEYRRALSRRVEGMFRAPGRGKEERGRMVRASCVRMVEDVMLFPGNSGALSVTAEVGDLFARLAEEDQSSFSYILDMSEHDYATTTHMVNVGIGCGLLVKELRPTDAKLVGLAMQGGLLHDIGKRDVPEETLNKEGKLSEAEWAQIRRHPTTAYEELSQQPGIDPVVLEMARDHHERLDGTGYPTGRYASELSFAARVCAVVDIYDSITAARPSRGPIAPAEALRLMADGVGVQFDQEIFETWRAVVGRMLREDPARAPARTGAGARRLIALMQGPPRTGRGGGGGRVRAVSVSELPERKDIRLGGERRMHPRRNCNLMILASFERQMKECPVLPGRAFEAVVLDLSRSGMQIQTSWPLSQNDLLRVEFRSGDQMVERRVRVVRVRRGADGNWVAGTCFVEAEGELRRTA